MPDIRDSIDETLVFDEDTKRLGVAAVELLRTAELDQLKKLVPDGYGGVEFVEDTGGGGDGLAPTALQTGGSYVAAVGDLVRIGALTAHQLLRPPAAPSVGARWGFSMGAGSDVFSVTIDGETDGVTFDWGFATSATRAVLGNGLRAEFTWNGTAWEYVGGNLDNLAALFIVSGVTIPDEPPGGEVDLCRFNPFLDGSVQSPGAGSPVGGLYEIDAVIQGGDTGAGFGPCIYQVIRAQFRSSGGAIAENFVLFVVNERIGLGVEVTAEFVLDGDAIILRAHGRDAPVDGSVTFSADVRVRFWGGVVEVGGPAS